MEKLTLLFLACLVFSCTKQENNQLANIESMMLTHPDSTNACLINIAEDYKALGNQEKYTTYINLTKNKIIAKYKANIALSETNAERGDYKAAWKFQNEAIKQRNIIDSIDNKQEAEKMKASYNYEMEVAKREEAEDKINKYKFAILISIICILGLSILILALKNSAKKRSIQQLKLIAQQNEKIQEQRCKIEELNNLMNEQNRKIKKLESRNNELSKYQLTSSETCINMLSKSIKFDDDKWNQFRMSEAYTKLHGMIRKGLSNYTNSELQEALEGIIITIDNMFNEYGKRLTASLPDIKDSQLKFAYLTKAEISNSNIAILLNKSRASITKTSKSFDKYFEKDKEEHDSIRFLHDF